MLSITQEWDFSDEVRRRCVLVGSGEGVGREGV